MVDYLSPGASGKATQLVGSFVIRSTSMAQFAVVDFKGPGFV